MWDEDGRRRRRWLCSPPTCCRVVPLRALRGALSLAAVGCPSGRLGGGPIALHRVVLEAVRVVFPPLQLASARSCGSPGALSVPAARAVAHRPPILAAHRRRCHPAASAGHIVPRWGSTSRRSQATRPASTCRQVQVRQLGPGGCRARGGVAGERGSPQRSSPHRHHDGEAEGDGTDRESGAPEPSRQQRHGVRGGDEQVRSVARDLRRLPATAQRRQHSGGRGATRRSRSISFDATLLGGLSWRSQILAPRGSLDRVKPSELVSLVMALSLERPILAEQIMSFESCRNVVRSAPWGFWRAPKLQSCPTLAQASPQSNQQLALDSERTKKRRLANMKRVVGRIGWSRGARIGRRVGARIFC